MRVAEEHGGEGLGDAGLSVGDFRGRLPPEKTDERTGFGQHRITGSGSAIFEARRPPADAPWLGTRFCEVESLDSLLLVGCDLRSEAPILAHRVRKAAMAGARVSYLDLAEREYLHPIGTRSVQPPRDWARALGPLAGRALKGRAPCVVAGWTRGSPSGLRRTPRSGRRSGRAGPFSATLRRAETLRACTWPACIPGPGGWKRVPPGSTRTE